MSKKIILFFISIIFFSGFHLTYANVVINEIMYAPQSGSNYEWVEIFNSGNTLVDLEGWRFFHGQDAVSSPSGPLTLRNGNTTILEPSEYAIIAKSPSVVTDYVWLNFSGMILSASTLSLPDGAENTYIAIASDTNKTISDSLIYDTSLGGSKDSGNSLQKIEGIWSGVTPTPGVANETMDPPSPLVGGSSDSSSASGGNTGEKNTKITEEQKIKVEITSPALVFANFPISFQAVILGRSGEQLRYGKYFWNFGDGISEEMKIVDAEKISHTYFYPGEYILSLEYFMNYYGDVPDASQKITIKVVKTDVVISAVGNEKDFFIELTNNTNYDTDISKWILSSDKKSFSLPRNTILGSKKKIIISAKITNFSILDKDTLRLITPQGEMVFDYPSSILPIVLVSTSSSLGGQTKTTIQPKISASQDSLAVQLVEARALNGQIPIENLSASVIESDVTKDGSGVMYPIIISLISIVFIGASAGAVYFVRQKRIVSNTGDDFNILEE
ncbi:hypothetical protein A3F19_01430 [Candidatus Nomurabacteria bacterium RIFCSPHIGHO2_12_FULL_37_29]|uniref:PKD domain-containing protein n=2 Tax=Candidatus Nomuraibacteriota TaxID=1752729 RepID=A0A1F6Y4M8_9BACT|nr:MAG: hypothetical protein A2727_00035 [Candidatus Nomurabacteria bacterium RIFCSPHIGHO2_01_FULL_37_110]OGI79364.1 MAG: hypothetical protein A3F19_01430 [Candidatus Nomurabacteria bacterium RIFCSPHIGHO2_12_FULL_37_29]OGI84829.1 MAG: hypothetical protein A3A92_00655 [Candidatus Nomurabacteria bacterium RIFCSPLOWO2_01_FULL_37_49]OGJ01296.1 MAG: hypothetical protein A3G98_01580 [Candidatus Nomurabacteria bacterium RIFCSPLOWO2_12_FULL_37_8]